MAGIDGWLGKWRVRLGKRALGAFLNGRKGSHFAFEAGDIFPRFSEPVFDDRRLPIRLRPGNLFEKFRGTLIPGKRLSRTPVALEFLASLEILVGPKKKVRGFLRPRRNGQHKQAAGKKKKFPQSDHPKRTVKSAPTCAQYQLETKT